MLGEGTSIDLDFVGVTLRVFVKQRENERKKGEEEGKGEERKSLRFTQLGGEASGGGEEWRWFEKSKNNQQLMEEGKGDEL